MSKELYRRLSKVERKLENTNRLRTNNTTLRIKYEGIKKLLEKKDKEIERLNNNWQQAIEDLSSIANELELEEGNTIYDILDKIKKLKGEDKE